MTPAARKAVAGQTYRVSVPPVRPAEPAAEAIPLAVVHEDAHLTSWTSRPAWSCIPLPAIPAARW